jgi:hypothetical protein
MSTSKKDYDPLSGLFGGGEPMPDVHDETLLPPEPNVRGLKPVSRRTPPPPPPAPEAAAGPDPAALARILAKAAAAKAGAPTRAPEAAPPPVPAASTLGGRVMPPPAAPSGRVMPPPAAPAAPAAGRAMPAPKPAAPAPAAAGGGRLAGLAAPAPRRTLTAAEAMEAARLAEAARAAEAAAPKAPARPAAAAPAAPAAPVASAAAPAAAAKDGGPGRVVASVAPTFDLGDDDTLTDRVQALVTAALPGAPLYVANAVRVDDRQVQRPVWKAHRARILASGDYRTAFAVSAIVQALADVPMGALVAGLVVRDGGDLLIWFDLRDGRPVAALDGGMNWGLTLS